MRVRLVEDYPDLIMLVRHVLEPSGVDLVVTDHDFADLLAREPWHDIDTAIIDIHLGEPDITGIDVLAWLKAERPDIRRVVFSAVTNGYLKELERLADRVLTKGAVTASSILVAVGVNPDA